MNGMNRVILIGNLGANPELRYTAAGTAVLSMRLATTESYVDRNTEPQERTEWHTVVVWGNRAREALSKILAKGACVAIEGSLRTSSYEKDGIKRYKTEVHVREVCILGKRPPGAASDVAGAPGEGASSLLGATRGNGFLAPRKEEPLDELPY